MDKFDFHTHIGYWKNSENDSKAGSLIDLSMSLKKNGITKAVVMPPDGISNQKLLEELIECDFSFYFFPWIDPNNREIATFLVENETHITGLKFSSSYDKIKGVTDPLYLPFVELAIKKNYPIIIHCGRWVDMAGYQFALDLAAKYPNLRIVCAHMGGVDKNLQLAAQDRVIADGLENVWFDTSAVMDSSIVERGVELLGEDRFFYGSDYPLFSQEKCIETVTNANLSPMVKEKLLWGNAINFLEKSC